MKKNVYPLKTSDLTLEEVKKIEKKCKVMQFELEGKIYLIQKDKNGKVLLKDEMNSQACLTIMTNVLSEYLDKYASAILETELSKKVLGREKKNSKK